MGFITGVVSIVLTAYSLRGWWRHKANKALFKSMEKTKQDVIKRRVEAKKMSAQEAYDYAHTNWVDLEQLMPEEKRIKYEEKCREYWEQMAQNIINMSKNDQKLYDRFQDKED